MKITTYIAMAMEIEIDDKFKNTPNELKEIIPEAVADNLDSCGTDYTIYKIKFNQ